MDGEYAPAISSNYPSESFGNIQFIIPKGSKGNYDIGAWKKLRVLEYGASTTYAFEVTEPGTLASLLTDDIKKNVVSLKLRGVLFSDDIKILEDCPNLRSLDLAETFIAQSPKELKERQETAEYLLGVFMGMGVIAQSEYEHNRMSTTDNLQVQYLAKLAEMAKEHKVQSDPNCQVPNLENTKIEEVILPLQLSEVDYRVFPVGLKKITLPPDLKKVSGASRARLKELILPASVQSFTIGGSKTLELIDLSACIDLKINLDASFDNLKTLKLPENYSPEIFNGSKVIQVSTSTPINVYFKGRELIGHFNLLAPEGSKIFIPKGSRAGYSALVDGSHEVIEQ